MKSLRFQVTLGWSSTLRKCLGYHEVLVNNRVSLGVRFKGNPRLCFTNRCLLQARTIRGFCHLYDGQEAVAAGVQSALDVTVSLGLVFQMPSSTLSDCHNWRWSVVLLYTTGVYIEKSLKVFHALRGAAR